MGCTHLGDFKILGGSFLENGLVSEAGQSGSHVVLLAHLEVLAEVLVTAPPVQVDHIEALVTSNLMEVSIPDVVLDTIGWESPVTVQVAVSLVVLADSEAPMLHHSLLLVLDHNVEQEAAPAVEDDHAPEESNTILSVERLDLPVSIAEGVLEEASNVFECSPSLGLVSGLFGVVYELAEVSISVLSQRSV